MGHRKRGPGRHRAIDAHPGLRLCAVVVHDPAKAGHDAGDLADLGRTLGVAATDDVAAVLDAGLGAVVYAASGDIRPGAALADLAPAVGTGAVVVTPSVYPLYDPINAPAALREPIEDAVARGDGSLFVSGVDPGWGNDILPVLGSGLASRIDSIRCQEIFDYTTYDQSDSVRQLIGMGHPMDYAPPMVTATVPTMVWGGQVRMIARALEVELDEIREVVERRPLDTTVETQQMGTFEAGIEGALRFEVQGIVGGDGAHKVVIQGRPHIEISLEATDEGGNRAAGGNATAAGRLVNAIPWLRAAEPGIYDALDIPLAPAVGRLGRTPNP